MINGFGDLLKEFAETVSRRFSSMFTNASKPHSPMAKRTKDFLKMIFSFLNHFPIVHGCLRMDPQRKITQESFLTA